MLKALKKITLGIALSSFLTLPTFAEISVPDIGTAGIMGLTVQKEEQIGNYFMRTARSRLPIVVDPVLDEYVSSVGNKLLMHAKGVQFPFEFFIVNNLNLNASAFLGGKVQINTGLFVYSDTEDEFASVLAHEISHVTQRHIARFIESEVKKSNTSIASMVGAIALSIINPAVGMAALSTSLGIAQQSRINFTRENESEADRIGIDLLNRAGFNPAGTTDMFRKLLNMQGNINPVFALLVDHPLSEVRIAEAENRIAHFKKKKDSTNPDFFMAKARIDVRYKKNDFADLKEILKNDAKANRYYKNYALALTCYELNEYAEAKTYLNNLGASMQNNLFVVDLLTDIDLKEHNYQSAINRLNGLHKRMPRNKAVIVNLANAYIQSGQNQKAIRLIRDYLKRDRGYPLSYTLLTEAYLKSGNRCEALQAQGEDFALKANYNRAIGSYNEALNICRNNLTVEIIKARVSELIEQRAFDAELNKSW